MATHGNTFRKKKICGINFFSRYVQKITPIRPQFFQRGEPFPETMIQLGKYITLIAV
jgi:hypothetical protein